MGSVWLALVLGWQAPAGELRLEEATFRQFEDGPPYQQAFRAGEEVFLDLRIAGYGRTEDENPELKLKWSIRAVDSEGVALAPAVDSRFQTGLAAQDTEYRPRARFSVAIPLFALDGSYRVEAKVTDEVTGRNVEGSFPFRVRGKQMAKKAALGTGPVRFFRNEEDTTPLELPVYRPGAAVWLKFDLEGFGRGAQNAFAVNYGVTVTGPDGKHFLKQDPAATQSDKPFYPQAYAPAAFMVQLPPKALAGEYRVEILVRDLAANQTHLRMVTFRVE